jgi:hypothetical protein
MNTNRKVVAEDEPSRRQFAKTIAAVLASVPLATSLANAQTAVPSAVPQPSPSPTPTPQPPSPVAEAYAEVARARFGKLVSPEQLSKIKEDLAGNVRSADRLRNYKLENSDEPDFVFSAD